MGVEEIRESLGALAASSLLAYQKYFTSRRPQPQA